MFVLMPCGYPVSGESYVSNKISSYLDIPLISTYDIRRDPELSDTMSNSVRDRVYEELQKRVSSELLSGNSLVIDAGFASRRHRHSAYRTILNNGAEPYVILCICDDLEIIGRSIGAKRDFPLTWDRFFHIIENEYDPVSDDVLPGGEKPKTIKLIRDSEWKTTTVGITEEDPVIPEILDAIHSSGQQKS